MAEYEEELRGRAHTTAIAALEVVPFAMLIADGAAQVLAVNGRWMELSGLSRTGSLGPGWLSVLEPEPRSRLRGDVVRVAREGGTVTVDYQVGGGPRKRWTRWWISRHQLEGLPLVAIGAADMDEDYARQANLYHLATHDSLTGLINRSHFIDCIDQALRRSARQSRRVAVVYVDLDGFKRVNDRGGHSLGDRVLFAIASRLRHAVRSADMVARIGGDEFAVLCEGLTAVEQADVVARRIALALTESVELDGERWSVAASVGAAVDRGDPDSAEELVDRADRAMYSIKQARRGPDDDGEEAVDPGIYSPPQPERRVDPETGYAYHTPRAPRRDDHGPGDQPGVSEGGSEVRDSAERDIGERDRMESGSGVGVRAEGAWTGSRQSVSAAGSAASAVRGSSPIGVMEENEARRALRDLAEAAGAFQEMEGGGEDQRESHRSPAPSTAGADQPEGGRQRLAADVVNLRESIDSIRRMLDRLLTVDSGVIDIRDQPER